MAHIWSSKYFQSLNIKNETWWVVEIKFYNVEIFSIVPKIAKMIHQKFVLALPEAFRTICASRGTLIAQFYEGAGVISLQVHLRLEKPAVYFKLF